jgi:hypothetical protein
LEGETDLERGLAGGRAAECLISIHAQKHSDSIIFTLNKCKSSIHMALFVGVYYKPECSKELSCVQRIGMSETGRKVFKNLSI